MTHALILSALLSAAGCAAETAPPSWLPTLLVSWSRSIALPAQLDRAWRGGGRLLAEREPRARWSVALEWTVWRERSAACARGVS